MLFGSGGTFTSLASMVMAGKRQSNQPARGYQVTRAEVRHLLERLRKLPLRERSGVPGLSPDRADIIVAGLAIVDRLMDRLQVNLLQVHNRGVRDGLLLTMIDRSLGAASGNDRRERQAAIERLGASAGGRIGARPARGPHGRPDLFAIGRRVRPRSVGSGAPGGGGPAARRGLSDQLRSAPQA